MRSKGILHYKFILYVIFITCFFNVLISHAYKPRIDLDGKLGNNRHIVRTGLLFPIYYTENSILFTPLFLMADNKDSLEGNFGIGFRYNLNQIILGCYGFYDIRKPSNISTKVHQINIGLEFLTTNYEFRFNGYSPREKSVFIGETNTIVRHFDTQTNITTESLIKAKVYDFILQGYDLEFGRSIPKVRQLNIFGSFYHFFRSDISMRGFRLRARHEIFYWLALTTEWSYDNIRKYNFYGGIRISYLFNQKYKSYNDIDRLKRKMTQLPVRDVDIIDAEKTEVTKKLREKETGYVIKLFKDDAIADLKKQGIVVDDKSSNAILTKKSANSIKVIVDEGVKIDNFVDSNLDGTRKSYLVSSNGILNHTASSVTELEAFLADNNIDVTQIFLPNSSPFTAMLVARRNGRILLANHPKIHNGVDLNNFVIIRINDPAVGLLGFMEVFDRLVTPNQREQHAVYRFPLNLPKNVVVQHPYIPTDNFVRPGQFDDDITRTLAALEMKHAVIPQRIIDKMKEFGVRLSSVKSYIVVQTKPWRIGTQILLRPQPLVGADASNAPGRQSREYLRAFRYDDSSDTLTSLSPSTIRVTVHDDRFSGNTLPTTLSSANSNAEFSLVIHNPGTSKVTAYITRHLLLNQVDSRRFTYQITNNMNPNSRMRDFVNRFTTPAVGPFLQSQYNTMRNFVLGE